MVPIFKDKLRYVVIFKFQGSTVVLMLFVVRRVLCTRLGPGAQFEIPAATEMVSRKVHLDVIFKVLIDVVLLNCKSCALTLARKHSLRSAQAAYNKFGPNLKVTSKEKGDAVVLFYPDSLKTVGKFNVGNPRYSQVAILQEPFEKKKWHNF